MTFDFLDLCLNSSILWTSICLAVNILIVETISGPSVFDLGWISGIVDGEGCFSASHGKDGKRPSIKFCLVSRYDDLLVQKRLRAILGCGRIRLLDRESLQSGLKEGSQVVAQCRFEIDGIPDAIQAIKVFDRCAFYTKKSMEYPIWKEIVEIKSSLYFKHSTPGDVLSHLDSLVEDLHSLKRDVQAGPLSEQDSLSIRKQIGVLI